MVGIFLVPHLSYADAINTYYSDTLVSNASGYTTGCSTVNIGYIEGPAISTEFSFGTWNVSGFGLRKLSTAQFA